MTGLQALHPGTQPGDVVELRFEQQWKVWEFPHDRFTTYEASDEGWCRFFTIPNFLIEAITPVGVSGRALPGAIHD